MDYGEFDDYLTSIDLLREKYAIDIALYNWDKNCDRALDTILNAAAANNTILEYNANGFRRGKASFPDGERYMYPHTKFWQAVADAKLPVIVGSDCHSPENMWDDAVKMAYKELEQLGIRPVTSF